MEREGAQEVFDGMRVAAVGRRMVPAKVERSRRGPAAAGVAPGAGDGHVGEAASWTTSSANGAGAASSVITSISTSMTAVRQLQAGLRDDFDLYNHGRRRQSLNYRTPAEEQFVL